MDNDDYYITYGYSYAVTEDQEQPLSKKEWTIQHGLWLPKDYKQPPRQIGFIWE